LVHQPRPPYYVLRTPTLDQTGLFGLMQQAQDIFELEFDPLPDPLLDLDPATDRHRLWKLDLDSSDRPEPAPPTQRAQAFTIWLRAQRLDRHLDEIARDIRQLLS